MKGLFALCICIVSLWGSRLDAQTPDTGRFRDPRSITADPTGLLRDTSVRAFPRYPVDLVKQMPSGSPVVAFVIDTTGRVEVRTATFLNASRKEFVLSVCDVLPKLRFQPFVLEGRKWRVLLVTTYGFNNWAKLDTATLNAASTLVKRSQEDFSTKPIGAVVEQLLPLPHCDSH